MSLLSAMIQKRERRQTAFVTGGQSVLPVATATVATFATVALKSLPSVATVASVAVANPQTVQAANDQPAVTSFGWLIHYPDRDPLMVTFSPEATHAEALAGYLDAVAAEPMPATPKRSATPDETIELKRLIEAVYRDDTESERCEALDAALADPVPALICYRAIALERGITLPDPDDDRRTCRQCSSFTYGGACSAASPGGLVSAVKGYRPAPDLLQRCGAFDQKGTK